MNIFDLIINSDLATKLFILFSVIILTICQYFILKIKYVKYLLILLLHIAFGLFLTLISSYNVIVHFIIYIIPSFLIAFFFYKIFNKNDSIKKGEIYFEYKTKKGKNLIIKENGIKSHIGVFGGSGSGKTLSILKPTIKQMSQHNIAGLIYDYKYFDLAKTAYTHYINSDVKFRSVNFIDLKKTFRINPIAPRYIIQPEYADDFAKTIIENLTKTSEFSEPYFTEAAEGILSGIIWKLKEDLPEYCYLPYVTSILTECDTKTIINFVKSNSQARHNAAAYFKAQGSDKTLANVESSLANALQKIAKPVPYWVLSGDDFDLNLSNPEDPKMLCITTNFKISKPYAPLTALIINVCSKQMSEKNQRPAGILIEEGSTIRIPNLADVVATLREYFVFVIFCVQDFSQGEIVYNKLGFKAIRSNLGSQFYGRVKDYDTAENYAKMYGKIFKNFTSSSRRSTDFFANNFTTSERQVFIKEPNEFLHLNEGHFFGIVSKGNVETFDYQFLPYTDEQSEIELPIINENATDDIIKQNFNDIIDRVNELMIPFKPLEKTKKTS